MSFLGILGNIGKGLLGMGGGNAGDIAGKVAEKLSGFGEVAGNAAKGAADQRLAEQFAILQQQNLAQQGARDEFDAGLGAAKFGASERQAGDHRGMLAALLGNLEDVKIGGMNPNIASRTPQISGGLRPSALTGGGNREALIAMLSKPGMEAPTFRPTPQMQLPQQGTGEKLLGGAGLVGGLLGAIGPQPKRLS